MYILDFLEHIVFFFRSSFCGGWGLTIWDVDVMRFDGPPHETADFGPYSIFAMLICVVVWGGYYLCHSTVTAR
ncbi:hypothetical protein FPV67DRAFT_1507556 [Lyophyllum atratum]|nr:hypothetical protein FPV67DRAFT_1507556 [Lyophyllum atratum]